MIPVFNRPALIAECLDSILAQHFSEWEALVVDDGSSDHTCDVIRAYAAQDERIHLIQRDHLPKGPAACRNIGLDRARGDYVMFHDSDDLLHPRCLGQRVEALDADPSLDFVVSPSVTFEGSPVNITGFLLFPFKRGANDLARFLTSDTPWLTSGPTWKRQFLLKNQYRWPENFVFWEDGIFHYRILFDRPNYERLEFYDSYYRVSNSNKVSGTTWDQKWLDLIFQEYPKMLSESFKEGMIDTVGIKQSVHVFIYRLQEQGYHIPCFTFLRLVRQQGLSHGKGIYLYCIAKTALNGLLLGRMNSFQFALLNCFKSLATSFKT